MAATPVMSAAAATPGLPSPMPMPLPLPAGMAQALPSDGSAAAVAAAAAAAAAAGSNQAVANAAAVAAVAAAAAAANADYYAVDPTGAGMALLPYAVAPDPLGSAGQALGDSVDRAPKKVAKTRYPDGEARMGAQAGLCGVVGVGVACWRRLQ